MTVSLETAAAGPRRGFVLPHAPVLLQGPGGRIGSAIAGVRAALASVTPEGCDLAVVVSPHGPTTGVYKTGVANLEGFGIPSIGFDQVTDPLLAATLAATWKKPALSDPPDHGIAVPLLLAGFAVPVLACTLTECTGPGAPGSIENAAADARGLAEAVHKLSAKARLAFVASAHSSAALHPRGPLQERPEGRVLAEAIDNALATDPALLCEIPAELWSAAGSCGAGPLIAFGTLFGGRPAVIATHEAPFGVGYIVAANGADGLGAS